MPAPIQKPYCLRCYAPLRRTPQATTPCTNCGYSNVKADQRLYWTREPKLIETEWLAKVGIVVFLGLLAYVMATGYRASIGTGQGWAVGFPILVGAVLWETASKITRKKPYFRATLFWSAIPLALALPIAIAALWPTGIHMQGRAAAGLVVLALVGFSLTARKIGSRLERWKAGRILRGQTQI